MEDLRRERIEQINHVNGDCDDSCSVDRQHAQGSSRCIAVDVAFHRPFLKSSVMSHPVTTWSQTVP